MEPDTPLQKLREYWGFDSFRPLQREAIECVLTKRDSVVVLPTGGGKSICYQVPAMCLADGMAVVVSPLLSLMKDQVDGLLANGISAASLNSSQGSQEQNRVLKDLRSGQFSLLYVSPERLVQPATLELLKTLNVQFFAIDEAHCISAWGHDFRPEYRQLNRLKEHFPDASVHAFTATATPRVREDITSQLNLGQATKLVGSFLRPNLRYRVQRRTNAMQQIKQVVDRYPGQSGIVYCISRKEVENVASVLCELGYRARPYHAGLPDDVRMKNQEDFIHEKTDIIVATVAFGMGIDKSSVRYVVHNGMPKSLEAYQQESGRAGRDGLPAECCLLYSGGDVMLWKKIAGDQPGVGDLLDAMSNYCTQTRCRHRSLVEYFGQALEMASCDACDVCLDEREQIADSLVVAQKILSCVYRVDQRFGANHVASVLTGSRSKRVLEMRHEKLSTYGLLSDYNKRSVAEWIEQLIGQGVLEKHGEYNVIRITDKGTKVLRGQVTPKLYEPELDATGSKESVDPWEGVDRGLFDELRAVRRKLAEANTVPPYAILPEATLRDLAAVRPSTLEKLASVAGFTERKRSDFGAKFIQQIAAYCSTKNLPQDQPRPAGRVIAKASGNQNLVKSQAFQLFAQGLSMESVAERLGRAMSTTRGYLNEFIREEAVTDASPWVPAEIAEKIRAAAMTVDSLERLAPIREILGEDYSWDHIAVVVACLRVESGYVHLS